MEVFLEVPVIPNISNLTPNQKYREYKTAWDREWYWSHKEADTCLYREELRKRAIRNRERYARKKLEAGLPYVPKKSKYDS